MTAASLSRLTTTVLAAAIVLVPAPASAGEAEDLAAVRQVLEQFRGTEDAGDIAGQEQLMAPDRTWIGPDGTRRTDNRQNMAFQAAQADVQKRALPGLQRFSFDRDYLIRLMGGGSVAVASFYRTAMMVYPPATPKELRADYPGYEVTGTVVLEKSSGRWKIVHTHWSGGE